MNLLLETYDLRYQNSKTISVLSRYIESVVVYFIGILSHGQPRTIWHDEMPSDGDFYKVRSSL